MPQTANLENFFAGANGPLTKEEVSKVKIHFAKALVYAGTEIEMAKLYYHRPRPYELHADINPCISKENSKSFPSGHATLARLYAQLLAKYYPEKRNELIERANAIALNRVIGGVHNPTDIEAGKKLGDALAEKILNDD
jgi:acid phosphatase (class A)